MKVLLTGATGFVGAHTLHALLADPRIATVLTLTRAPLSKSPYITSRHLESAKLVEIVHDDLGSYPPALLERLRGVRACVWCVGGRHTQRSRWPTDDEYVRVSVEYSRACAEALAGVASAPLRFVFCSGHATELDQGKSLWVMERTRKVKGMAESALFEVPGKIAGRVEAYSVRPCGIYQKNPTLKDRFLTAVVLPSCRVEELAVVMVEVAVEGNRERIVPHEKIKEWGGRLLKEGKGGE